MRFLMLSLVSILFCLSAPSARAANPINLKDYGAAGDGVTDDGPALQAALNALASQGGGTLNVPPGDYAIITPATKAFGNLASSVIISGDGANSILRVKTGGQGDALTLTHLESLLIQNLAVAGTNGVSIDVRRAINLQEILQATVRNVHFYGVAAGSQGGAVLYTFTTNLILESSSFRGCTANYEVGTSVLEAQAWYGVNLRQVEFIDFGTLNGVGYSKTPFSAADAWVRVGHPAFSAAPSGAGRHIQMRDVRCDEGAPRCIVIAADSSALVTADLTGINVNMNSLDFSVGVEVSNLKNLRLRDSWFGWGAAELSRPAVRLTNVSNATLEHLSLQGAAKTIVADSNTFITIVDSIYQSLQTTPALTRIINGGNMISGSTSSPTTTAEYIGGGGLKVTALADPAAPTVVGLGVGSSMSYWIVGVDRNGNRTALSPPGTTPNSAAWPSSDYPNQITWTPIDGAVRYDVLRGNTSTKLVSTTGTFIQDQGQYTPSAYTPPTQNTTAGVTTGGNVQTSGQLISTARDGTAPLSVVSQTLVENLNANFLQGLPATAFLKTTGSGAINLPANGLQVGTNQMVTAGGNVGIGLNIPAYRLDVSGQVNTSGGLCIAGDCKTAWSQVGGSKWTTASSNIYYSGGNVGIGTSDPRAMLQVGTHQYNQMPINTGLWIAGPRTLRFGSVNDNPWYGSFFRPGYTSNSQLTIGVTSAGADSDNMTFLFGGRTVVGSGSVGANTLTVNGGASFGSGFVSTPAPANGILVQGPAAFNSFMKLAPVTLGSMGTPAAGSVFYCADCVSGSSPCQSGGTGTFAFGVPGAGGSIIWKCL